MSKSVYEMVTDRIISQLEQAVAIVRKTEKVNLSLLVVTITAKRN